MSWIFRKKFSLFIVLCFHLCSAAEDCFKLYSDAEADLYCANKGKRCNSNADCKGSSKTCNCDGNCGMNCFNLNLNCTDVLSITNGVISYSKAQMYGSIAKFTCNDGYLLNQTQNVRRCLANKQWDRISPTCNAGCLTPPAPVLRSYTDMYDDVYAVGTEFYYKCNYGYDLIVDNDGTARSECLASLQWSETKFKCVPVNCGEPTKPSHGDFVRISLALAENAFASEIEYVCNKGYERVGSTNAVCLADRRWSNDPPKCNIVECSNPPAINNAKVTNPRSKYEYFDEVTYECIDSKYGLILADSKKAKCDHLNDATGTWVNLPQCKVNPNCTFEGFRAAEKKCGYTMTNWQITNQLINTRYSFTISPTKGVENAKFISTDIPLPFLEYCLTFQYKTDLNNAINLEFTDVNNNKKTSFFLPSTLPLDQWNKIELQLTPKKLGIPEESADKWNALVRWSFVNTNVKSDVYIDDIFLEEKACTNPTPYSDTDPPMLTTTQVAPTVTSDATNSVQIVTNGSPILTTTHVAPTVTSDATNSVQIVTNGNNDNNGGRDGDNSGNSRGSDSDDESVTTSQPVPCSDEWTYSKCGLRAGVVAAIVIGGVLVVGVIVFVAVYCAKMKPK